MSQGTAPPDVAAYLEALFVVGSELFAAGLEAEKVAVRRALVWCGVQGRTGIAEQLAVQATKALLATFCISWVISWSSVIGAFPLAALLLAASMHALGPWLFTGVLPLKVSSGAGDAGKQAGGRGGDGEGERDGTKEHGDGKRVGAAQLPPTSGGKPRGARRAAGHSRGGAASWDGREVRQEAAGAWRNLVNAPAVEAAWELLSDSIIQEFIYDAWWTQITDDRQLPAEARRLLNNLFGELSSRAKDLDLRPLLLRDVPDLLVNQLETFRDTMEGLELPDARHLTLSARERAISQELAVEGLLHPALRSQQAMDRYLQRLCEGMVAMLLPASENKAVRVLCRELLARSVLSNVITWAHPWHANRLALYLLQQADPSPALTPAEAAAAAQARAQAAASVPAGQHIVHRARRSAFLERGDVAAAEARSRGHGAGASRLGPAPGEPPPTPVVPVAGAVARGFAAEAAAEVTASPATSTTLPVSAPAPSSDAATQGGVGGDFLKGSGGLMEDWIVLGKARPESRDDLADNDGAPANDASADDALRPRASEPPPPAPEDPSLADSAMSAPGPRDGTDPPSPAAPGPVAPIRAARVVAAEIVQSRADQHVSYKVRVTDAGDRSWTVSRRYREFEALHRALRDLPEYCMRLPPKRFLVHTQSPEFVESRRRQLDKYLTEVLQDPLLSGLGEVLHFLCSQQYPGGPGGSARTLDVVADLTPVRSASATDPTGIANLAAAANASPPDPRSHQAAASASASGKVGRGQPGVGAGPAARRRRPVRRTAGGWSSWMGGGRSAAGSSMDVDGDDDERGGWEWDDNTKMLLPLDDLVSVVFQLDSRGWFRRQVILVARQILSLMANTAIEDYLRQCVKSLQDPNLISRAILSVHSSLWPGGVWFQRRSHGANVRHCETQTGLSFMQPREAGPAPEAEGAAARRFGHAEVDGEATNEQGVPPLDSDEMIALQREVSRRVAMQTPEAMVLLLGEAACQQGLRDVFSMMQSEAFVKQLALGCLELSVTYLFPELRTLVSELRSGK
ncbi:unnamed protein product [Pedinophyceae sp. YPF-701]|nr:unnamed protein product [Pedinophyceae sp. YPF-701]